MSCILECGRRNRVDEWMAMLPLRTASRIKPTCLFALAVLAVHGQEKSWLSGLNRYFAPTMSASWSKIHEDLNTSAFYQRVRLHASIWQRLQRGGMFLAVTAVLVPVVANYCGLRAGGVVLMRGAGAGVVCELRGSRRRDVRHEAEPPYM
jgi:hypothetical protein